MQNTDLATPPVSLDEAWNEAAAIVAALEILVPCAEHEIRKTIDSALRKLEAGGASDDEKKPLIWEMRLWTFGPSEAWRHESEDEKLMSLTERFGDSGKDVSLFSSECEPYFASRFQATQNPILQARYADFLGVRALLRDEKDEARDWIVKAITAYLQSVPLLAPSPEVLHQVAAFQALDSAAHFAMLRASDLLPQVVEGVRKHLALAAQSSREVEGKVVGYGRWAIETGWIFLGLRQRQPAIVTDEVVTWWQNTAQELARKNQPLNEPFLEQSFWAQAATAADLLRDKKQQFAAMRAMTDAKVREAVARAQGQNASPLAAAAMLEAAVDYLDTLRSMVGDKEESARIAQQQSQLKLQIRRYYAEGEKEFGIIEIPLEIDPELLESNVLKFVEPELLTECLYRVGASLLPDVGEAKAWADSQKGEPGLLARLGVSQVGDGFEVRTYHSDDEKHDWKFYRALDLQLHLNNRIILPRVWEKLREGKKLDCDKLLAHFEATNFVGERNRAIVKVGLERYFADDFTSALHILVPQFEDLIRRLFERMGLPPIKQSRGGNGWEYETFGALLRRIDEQLPGSLPEKLRVYVQRTLSDPTGWNLRNRIAHGFLYPSDCNRFTTETVLHLYLTFCLFQESPEEENQ